MKKRDTNPNMTHQDVEVEFMNLEISLKKKIF